MGCIEHKKSPAVNDTGQDYNPFDAMEPRLPEKTPVDRRNGKPVKANDIPPAGVYLPNNNYLAPHMKSPEYVQLSTAAAGLFSATLFQGRRRMLRIHSSITSRAIGV